MLLCGIVNELKKSMAKTDLLSYFFCQATDSRINNATAILRGLSRTKAAANGDRDFICIDKEKQPEAYSIARELGKDFPWNG
jgi:hypothetical protein